MKIENIQICSLPCWSVALVEFVICIDGNLTHCCLSTELNTLWKLKLYLNERSSLEHLQGGAVDHQTANKCHSQKTNVMVTLISSNLSESYLSSLSCSTPKPGLQLDRDQVARPPTSRTFQEPYLTSYNAQNFEKPSEYKSQIWDYRCLLKSIPQRTPMYLTNLVGLGSFSCHGPIVKKIN